MDYKKINKIIENFTKKQGGQFSLEDIFDELYDDFPNIDSNELNSLCVSNKKANLIEFIDSSDETQYIQRDVLFNGSQFCIKPTPSELENNILFPGHRFTPFCNGIITPKHIVLQDQNKLNMESKNFEIPLMEATVYHTLFGRMGMIESYSFENNENIKAIDEDGFETDITLTVFDMKSFYKENKIKADDILVVEVVNWKAGIAYIKKIVRSSKRKTNFASISNWVDEFMNAYEDVCMDFGAGTSAELQLERIFAQTPQLLESPVIHIGGALQLGDDIVIHEVAGKAVLWSPDDDPEESLSLTDLNVDHFDDSELSELDRTLLKFGVPYSTDEIDAIVRNEYYHKTGASHTQIFNKYFKNFEKTLGKNSLSIVKDYLAEVNKEIGDSYNVFVDNNAGVFRAKIIPLKVDMVNGLIKIENSVDDINDLPTKMILQFSEIMSFISQSLVMTNANDSIITKKELDSSLIRLRELDDHAHYIMDQISDYLK